MCIVRESTNVVTYTIEHVLLINATVMYLGIHDLFVYMLLQLYLLCFPTVIQKFSGVAPITQKSGNKCIVLFRYACPKFIRQTFVEFAGLSIAHSMWAKAFYTMQIDKGKTYQMAVRALAFRWIRIITKCWKENKTYDEMTYLKALQKRKSPVLKYLATTP